MKRAVIFLADGFEEIEALTVADILRRANVKCDLCSITNNQLVTGSHSISVKADCSINDNPLEIFINSYECFILPGGLPGSTNLRDNETVIELFKKAFAANKLICAICAAPIVLEKAGILKNRKATSYPGYLKDSKDIIYCEMSTVVDGNVITSRGAGTSSDFAFTILRQLGLGDAGDTLKKSMLF